MFNKLYQVQRLLQAGEREFPAQLVAVFLYIAENDGCGQAELAEATGFSPSSVSRCVSWLGSHHRLAHRNGKGWVERKVCPQNYKARRVYLTRQGKQICHQILQIMA